MEVVMNLIYIAVKSTFFVNNFKYKFMFYLVASAKYLKAFDSTKTLRINQIVNQIIQTVYLSRLIVNPM